MIYTDIALGSVIAAVFFDLYGIKTQLLSKSIFGLHTQLFCLFN